MGLLAHHLGQVPLALLIISIIDHNTALSGAASHCAAPAGAQGKKQ
jgi:hypothetical protein